MSIPKPTLSLFLLCLMLAAPLHAGDEGVMVKEHNGIYKMMLRVESTLPVARLFECLTDYSNLHHVNGDIRESRQIGEQDGKVLVQTTSRSCLVGVCKSVEKVELVSYQAPNLINATIVPHRSDFAAGKSKWMLLPNDHGGTTIEYYAMLEPDDPLLPLVGKWLAKKALYKELQQTAENLRGNACLLGG